MKPEGEARSRLPIKWQLWIPTAYDGTAAKARAAEQFGRGFGWRQLVIITLVEARGSKGVCPLLPGRVEALEATGGGGR